MYGIIRLIIFLIIFLIGFFIIKRSHIKNKKLILMLLLVLCMILCSLSFLIPFENSVKTFDSPEEAYNYKNNGEIIDVIYGEHSCLIIGTETFDFILKTDNGYQISKLSDYKKVTDILEGDRHATVYNIVNSSDYYLLAGATITEDSCIVSDDGNSNFKIHITNIEDTEYYIVEFYGYIEKYTNDYSVSINDEVFPVH